LSPAIQAIAPRYVRLSGEIADQATLDALSEIFPAARLIHAYASTEAGVAFEVVDGREGFPSSYIDRKNGLVDMKMKNGSLHIRSPGTALRYLSAEEPLLDADGFLDSGDMIEMRGDRCLFLGRRGGIINVGGLKVHPEEIESVINRHPEVRMSLVRSRRNPITGGIVVADVVLRTVGESHERAAALKSDILQFCSRLLPPHKVPAAIRVVSSFEISAAGKLARHNA
jgi:acyl-CoA synthetase (AMP-forming)/AMP-acid ligase II